MANVVGDDHRLVVYAINGLTSEKSMTRHMPNMAKFFQQGGATSKMRTTYGTQSPMANWIGIFHGSSSVEFGCDNNGCSSVPRMDPDARSFVSILEDDHGYKVEVFSEDAFAFNNMLEREEDLDVHSFDVCSRGLYEGVAAYRDSPGRSLLVVHVACLDNVGESDGYARESYDTRVSCLDKELANLSRELWSMRPNSTTFMFVANHGGAEHSHGKFNLDTITIPFAVWGRGFRSRSSMIGEPMITQEVAPTLFKALGFEESSSPMWFEHPIQSDIYGEGATFAALDTSSIQLVDAEECKVIFTIRYTLARGVYLAQRILFSLLILAFAMSMFFH